MGMQAIDSHRPHIVDVPSVEQVASHGGGGGGGSYLARTRASLELSAAGGASSGLRSRPTAVEKGACRSRDSCPSRPFRPSLLSRLCLFHRHLFRFRLFLGPFHRYLPHRLSEGLSE